MIKHSAACGRTATLLALVCNGLLPLPAQAEASGTRYPQLTSQDIAVCRNEFAAVQGDVVQHFRLEAASYSPGGKYYRGDANSASNASIYNQNAQEIAAKDPVTFYYEGLLSDGQGVGDIPTMNGFDGPTAYGLYKGSLNREPQRDGEDVLEWGLFRDQVAAAADRCVAQVYFQKFDAMNPQIAANGPGPLGLRDAQFPSTEDGSAAPTRPAPTGQSNGDVWGSCVSTEGPEPSGIQMIYYLRNSCNQTITVSFCMKATYEAAGDWNLCSQREYKTFDIKAGSRLEFPFTPLEPGDALSDGRVVDHNEVSALGHACVGSSPSVYIENKNLMFQHC